jgi:hypothetical protein
VAGQQAVGETSEWPDRRKLQQIREKSTLFKVRKQLDERVKSPVNGPVLSDKKDDIGAGRPWKIAKPWFRLLALIGQVRNPVSILLAPPFKMSLGGHAHAAFAVVYQDTFPGGSRRFGWHNSAWQTGPSVRKTLV